MRPLPSSASPTAAPSATSTPDHVRGLEPRDLGLRLQDVRVHRLGQRLERRLDPFGQRPRRALRERHRAARAGRAPRSAWTWPTVPR